LFNNYPILKNIFARNVAILASGTAIAQAIPIAISPILTRIYSPSDFGMAALYFSIVSILAVVVTGRYEQAITLPIEDEDAVAISFFTVKISIIISFALYIPIFLFGQSIAEALGNQDLTPWLYLLPVTLIVTTLFSVIQFWLNRKSQYRDMAQNRVANSAYISITTVLFGLMKNTGGMILGGTLGKLFASLFILKKVKSSYSDLLNKNCREKENAVARTYIKHPKQLAPAGLIGVIAQQLPIFIISNSFAAAATGFYSLAYRLVSLPTELIAKAIGDVYRQKIADAYNKKGDFRSIYLKTLGLTSSIAILPFSLLYLVAPDLFGIVFGKEWRVAGEYAQILVVSSFFQFVFTPLDKGAVVVGATTYVFIWNILRFALYTLLAIWTIYNNPTITFILWLFIGINIIIYSIDGLINFLISK
jgi:O-antigen/teichoic acid export membrane protein